MNKAEIKRDCAECARKHLLAAYALTGRDCGFSRLSARPAEVLLARAAIALCEAENGYPAHAALAAGLLAAAEPMYRPDSGMPTALRSLRKRLDEGADRNGAVNIMLDMVSSDPVSWALAHLAEARREWPEGVEGAEDPVLGTADEVLSAVRELETTYELVRDETPVGEGGGDA